MANRLAFAQRLDPHGHEALVAVQDQFPTFAVEGQAVVQNLILGLIDHRRSDGLGHVVEDEVLKAEESHLGVFATLARFDVGVIASRALFLESEVAELIRIRIEDRIGEQVIEREWMARFNDLALFIKSDGIEFVKKHFISQHWKSSKGCTVYSPDGFVVTWPVGR